MSEKPSGTSIHAYLTIWESHLSQVKKRTNPPLTSILSHHRDTGHPVSFDDFKILSSCPFESELLLRESLLIRNLKSSLNATIGSAPLFLL